MPPDPGVPAEAGTTSRLPTGQTLRLVLTACPRTRPWPGQGDGGTPVGQQWKQGKGPGPGVSRAEAIQGIGWRERGREREETANTNARVR